jgi:DNA polymerase-3 subunit delta'
MQFGVMSNASSTDNVEAVFDGLVHSVEAGRLAHAYLLVGDPEGAAHDLLLRLLAMVFAHEDGGDAEKLESRFAERKVADVTWLEPQSKGRLITVDQVRGLNRRIATTSFSGGWKAGVILHADRLNDAAANAFLKTLEEPPARSLLLLLTAAPQYLLPTIVSRCQRLNLHEPARVPAGDWREDLLVLLREGPPHDPLEACCRAGRLNRLLKDEKERIEESVREAFAETEEDEKVIDARISARLRASQEAVMRATLMWHRDILVVATAGGEASLHFPGERDRLAALAAGHTWSTALAGLQAVETGRFRLDRNLPALSVFEGMFVEQGRAAQDAAIAKNR